MKRTILALVAALALCANAWGYELAVPSELEKLRKGFEYVYDEHYPEAEAIFRDYIARYPDRPEGYFFMAGRYAEYMNGYHDRSVMPEYEKWATLTVQKAEAAIAKNPDNVAGHFYLGNIYGYKGLLEAQQQNLVTAFLDAVKAKGYLEKVIELDPTVYDAYFGLGSLYFYGSKKHVEEGGMVGWIVKKFITHSRDMREEGIGMLQKAVANGGITADSAFGALMWMLIVEGRYGEAQVMADEMVRRWPTDKHGYWARGRMALLGGDCAAARGNFEAIVKIIERQGNRLERFPELSLALELAALCEHGAELNYREREMRIRMLRGKLLNEPNIQLEYANSKGVVRDFRALLAKLEKEQYLQKGNNGLR